MQLLWPLQQNRDYTYKHCLFGCCMASNKLLHSLFHFHYIHLRCSLASLKDSWFIHYICYAEMQLNSAIKSINWYWALVALLILIRYHQNSTDTNTGIGIFASLVFGYTLI